jgi:SAM-dependent methyltransferase
MSQESYDKIAAVYATDMGSNMRFDDVGYYSKLCRASGGPILELGCGTGRILLPLLQSGLDIDGIDQSAGMLDELRRQAAALQLQPQVALGTLTNFGTARRYNVILAPYSVVTYLTDAAALAAFFVEARKTLQQDGLLVVDTFIPRDVVAFDDFRLDYRRPHEGGVLQREKRIATQGACNCIERRYTLFDASDTVLQTWTTLDTIRPWTAAELIHAALGAGLRLVDRHVDYAGASAANPQFVELHFRR